MLSYPYIEDLFRAILAKSDAIKGRFFIAPYKLSEINSGNLEQLISDSMGDKPVKQYPLALLMPPSSYPAIFQQAIKESYDLQLFFLKQTGVASSGAIQNLHAPTNTTRHRVVHDWHDMKRCALSFMQALKRLISETELSRYALLSSTRQVVIDPVTDIGNDKLSGVVMRFSLTIAGVCNDLEDYADLSNITIPTTDSHPQHAL